MELLGLNFFGNSRMDKIKVSNLSDFIIEIDKLASKWGRLWYRGVKNINYNQIPSIFWKNLAYAEGTLIHKFLVEYKGILDNVPENPWELYALMQHHGLPTRLLDWTKSPLIALYFALEKYENPDNEAVVWVMSPYQLNEWSTGFLPRVFCPSELRNRTIKLSGNQEINLDSYLPINLDETKSGEAPKCPLAIEAPLSNLRIRAQQGCFTIHNIQNKSIDNLFRLEIEKPMFVQISIKGIENKDKILSSLHNIGVDEAFVYQNLDSLSNKIVRESMKPNN